MPKLASLATLNDWYENGMQEVREFDSPRLHQGVPAQVLGLTKPQLRPQSSERTGVVGGFV